MELSTAMRPQSTIRNLLVHPKHKVNIDKTAECVIRIPCKNCQKVYIGETGCSFGVRMKVHQKEVELQEGQNMSEVPTDTHSQSRINLQLQVTSKQRITSSTGARQPSSAVSTEVPRTRAYSFQVHRLKSMLNNFCHSFFHVIYFLVFDIA